MKIAVVIPSYFEGKNLQNLLSKIELSTLQTFKKSKIQFFISDESLGLDQELIKLSLDKANLKLVVSGERFGNQGAIINALEYLISMKTTFDYVVVMDGDGEDDPKHVPILIKKLINERQFLVLAKRGKRFTNNFFRIGKLIFNLLFKFLTGKNHETGNFSAFRYEWIREMLKNGRFLESFAGEISSIETRKSTITLDRSRRLDGKTRTSFIGYVRWALNQLTPWSELIRVRFFIYTLFSLFTLTIFLIVGIILRVFTDSVAPNWVTTVTIGITVISLTNISIFLISSAIYSNIMTNRKMFKRSN